MNLRKPRLAAVAVSAQAAARSVRRDATDVLLVVLIDAALVVVHLLRRAARVRLRYLQFSDDRRRAAPGR